MYNKIKTIVLLYLMLLLFSACEKSEIKEHYYSSYKQLGESSEPGNWVSSFIPHSAVDIRVKYKIDTGAELLTFRSAEAENSYLTGHCNKKKEMISSSLHLIS